MYFRRFLDACARAYDAPQIQAGPDGRDGACLIEDGDCRILAFRGTVTSGPVACFVGDWLNDLHANKVEDARFPGKVHAGFLDSISNLWPGVTDALQKSSASKPLVLTGHSKGGALAFLAGVLLSEVKPLVVTFGAPRVGDAVFASSCKLAAYRFESIGDKVPQLPPWGYEACGRPVYPPFGFIAPIGLVECHQLDTGYAPWVA